MSSRTVRLLVGVGSGVIWSPLLYGCVLLGGGRIDVFATNEDFRFHIAWPGLTVVYILIQLTIIYLNRRFDRDTMVGYCISTLCVSVLLIFIVSRLPSIY